MHLDWETTPLDGALLVAGQLSNDTPVDRRVRLENRLDGPVLPPRANGVPEAGWDENGYETVVPAGERVAVGYACPVLSTESPVTESPPTEPRVTEPPAELVANDRATADDAAEDTPLTLPAVVRRLGAAEPPRDAVPTRQFEADSVSARSVGDVGDVDDVDDACDVDPDVSQTTPRGKISGDPALALDDPVVTDADSPASDETPDAVSTWFSAVESRVGRAERLTSPSVATATATLAAAGGLGSVVDLQARVDVDAAHLRALAERAESLADRAESTDVSLRALRRLA